MSQSQDRTVVLKAISSPKLLPGARGPGLDVSGLSKYVKLYSGFNSRVAMHGRWYCEPVEQKAQALAGASNLSGEQLTC